MTLMYNQPVDKMKDIVISHMQDQEKRGELSRAHSYDHVENVSRYSGAFAGYFANKLGADPEKAAVYAKMAGWCHDIVRYASQVKSGEEESATLLESLYESNFASLPRDEYQRFVVDVVKNSDRTFRDMQNIYANDPQALAVAMALVVGDKLIETSGPRVLERRCFFIGERMKNPQDLGAALKHPEESPEGVLSETFVRLGDVNHISNYTYNKSLLNLAQELHVSQYQLYKGLLSHFKKSESDALDYIIAKLTPVPKLAQRVSKGGERLVQERHMDGTYFTDNNMDILLNALREMPNEDDLADSTLLLVMNFANAKTPEELIEKWKNTKDTKLPHTYKKWMDDIVACREGKYAESLISRLG